MKPHPKSFSRFVGFGLALTTGAIESFAQATRVKEAEFVSKSGDHLVYTIIFIVLSGMSLAFYLWRKTRKVIADASESFENRDPNYFSDNYDMNDVDAEKELEWLRKAKKRSTPKIPTMTYRADATADSGETTTGNHNGDAQVDTKIFQERMKMLRYAQLPINSFNELAPAKLFEPLQESNAKNLLDAIDQANVEFEPDELVRDVAIKVLSAFRTVNSVDALSQMALYDLSAALRAKAVTILADLDHESVFESILLACADPSREVRAAAARGLFRLNFDRSCAWKRLIDTDDEYRMRQAVGAAVEAGIATKSFERLIHEDLKVAYEAFTLVALMVRSGETDEIFDALRDHKDERVKVALLHVLKVSNDERAVARLDQLIQNGSFSPNVMSRMQETADSLKGHTARISA